MGEQQKKKKQSNKGRQLMKRQRTFPDEDEGEEVPRSPTAATIGELPLSAPQSSQISQASEARQFIFMPTPKVHMQQSNNNEDPDFEIPGFEFEEDPAIRPRSVSEQAVGETKNGQAKRKKGQWKSTTVKLFIFGVTWKL
ncbi:uncharacterized protein [Nicotiana tomentosiformis]|nr:uncharacterized protein LOC104117170 isoform X2 [Nicotiana tomentosiformis]